MFRPDIPLTEFLKTQKFTVSAEVIPPRNGAEQLAVLSQIEALVEAGSQFLAVTKGAGGSLRGGSLPIAQAIKERFGLPCIAHFTCRDLIPAEVENALMDHHYFGIRNILALRGDPPDGQTQWEPRPGGYLYAHQLIGQIRDLNEGKYLVRTGGPAPAAQTKTEFCIGAAAYPEHPDFQQGLDYFQQKVEAGADFGITDMLFDPEVYARFCDGLARRGVQIPILPGTRVLKTRSQAERMMKKFRVQVPASTLDRLPDVEDAGARDRGVELFLRLSERLRELGAPGMHVFVIADTPIATASIQALLNGNKAGTLAR